MMVTLLRSFKPSRETFLLLGSVWGASGANPARKRKRDSSLRDPAHKNRAQERSRVAAVGMTKERSSALQKGGGILLGDGQKA